MAITAGFKQQCPSCEAMVPIRDPKLIGRKIDCPKCKYRFVVEDPGEPAEEDEEVAQDEADAKGKSGRRFRDEDEGTPAKGKSGPRRRPDEAEEEGKPKKKGLGSPQLMIGIGLGVVALILLGVVGWLFWGGGDNASTASRSGGSSTPATPPGDTGEEKEKANKAAAPAATPLTALTHLLPAETEAIADIHLKELMATPLGRTIFDTPNFIIPGVFRAEGMSQRLGFPVDKVDLLLQGWSFTGGWAINVVHVTEPIDLNKVKAALGAKNGTKVNNQEYFILDANPWLETLGRVSAALLLQMPVNLHESHARQLALWQRDPNTVVIADEEAVKALLQAGGQFKKHAQPAPVAQAPAGEEKTGGKPGGMTGMMDGGRGGRGGPPPGMRGPPSVASAGSGGTPRPGIGGAAGAAGTQAAGGDEPPPPPTVAFLTVDPRLKKMLDRLESKKPLLSLALNTGRAAEARVPILRLNTVRLHDILRTVLEESTILGTALQMKENVEVTLALDCANEDIARKFDDRLRGDDGKNLATALTEALGSEVKLATDEANQPAGPGGRRAAAGTRPGGPAGMMGPGGMGQGQMSQAQMMMGQMMQQQRRRGQGRGGPGGAGGEGDDAMAGRPGAMGAPQQGRFRPPGMTGQNPPQEEQEPEKPTSTIKVTLTDKTLELVRITLIDQAANAKVLDGGFRHWVLQQKGNLDMADGKSRVHELANAIRTHEETHQRQFPRGTIERPVPSSRAGRPYPPDQRLSWLTEILPNLGPDQQALYSRIQMDKSWRDPEKNLGLAATLVPQFLDPANKQRWVLYPGMTQETAATHYVGIAGIGLDAASYPANDPQYVNKLGVFGYDRATRLSDIKDGASNTIFAAEVPSTFKRPWMAGGGATVQGVPEKGSVRPFVSTKYGGKAGTMAIMADGSVRFVPETISDDVFQALCTINGGESVIVNRDAPKVNPPEERVVEAAPVQPPQLPDTAPGKAGPRPTARGGAATGWKPFTSKEGGFTALLPAGTPVEQKQTVNTPVGEITVHVVGVQVKKDEEGYLVIYSDLPGGAIQQSGIADAILENAKAGATANVPGSKLTGEKKISLGSYPGRELDLELPNKVLMRIHVYLVKNRQYQVIATASKEKLASKDVERFFASFKVEN
jgi:hypothetical protein